MKKWIQEAQESLLEAQALVQEAHAERGEVLQQALRENAPWAECAAPKSKDTVHEMTETDATTQHLPPASPTHTRILSLLDGPETTDCSLRSYAPLTTGLLYWLPSGMCRHKQGVCHRQRGGQWWQQEWPQWGGGTAKIPTR